MAGTTYNNRRVSDAKAAAVVLRSMDWTVDGLATTIQLPGVVLKVEDDFESVEEGMESRLQIVTLL